MGNMADNLMMDGVSAHSPRNGPKSSLNKLEIVVTSATSPETRSSHHGLHDYVT